MIRRVFVAAECSDTLKPLPCVEGAPMGLEPIEAPDVRSPVYTTVRLCTYLTSDLQQLMSVSTFSE